jgi:hypothetical protein
VAECVPTETSLLISTPMNNPSIIVAKLPSEIEAVKFIRKRVFQEEQGVRAELDFDGEDENCDL